MSENELLKCDECGLISKDVKTLIDPYMDELYNEIIHVNYCEECYRNRLGEV